MGLRVGVVHEGLGVGMVEVEVEGGLEVGYFNVLAQGRVLWEGFGLGRIVHGIVGGVRHGGGDMVERTWWRARRAEWAPHTG